MKRPTPKRAAPGSSARAKPPTPIVARRPATPAPLPAAEPSGTTGRRSAKTKPAASASPRPKHTAPERPGFVEIGYVEKAHGLEGEVRVVPHNVATTSFARGNVIHLGVGPGSRPNPARVRDEGLVAHRIRAVRPVPGGFLVRFDAVASREAADALRSLAVYVDRSALPPPEPGEVYASDLVGARVELVDGNVIGSVERVVDYPSVSALVVRRDDGAPPLEVPMVDAYVAEIDAEAHLVKLHHVDEL